MQSQQTTKQHTPARSGGSVDKNGQPLLEVKGLKTYFYTEDGVVQAINGVDFVIRPGEVMGLVGESGSGKSVTSLSIMRLLPSSGKIVDGQILLEGRDLVTTAEGQLVKMRGDDLSMIFQQPASCLNPVFRIGDQIAETIMVHQQMSSQQAWKQAVEMRRKVGIPDPERRATAFPHEISGGQAQRVMIAMALSCLPKLLIADEPTTALDVTIQAQILDLMRKLRSETGTAILLITHNLGLVADVARRVAVMYAGQIVEEAPARHLLSQPVHPYTRALIRSVPEIGVDRERLPALPGQVPVPGRWPDGCRFAPRCPSALASCATSPPEPASSLRWATWAIPARARR